MKSRSSAPRLERSERHERGDGLRSGRSIGQRIGAGRARVVEDLSDMRHVEPGDLLVTDMTDPDSVVETSLFVAAG